MISAGNDSVFSISAEFDHFTDSYAYGFLCFHIEGMQCGDFKALISLGHCHANLKEFAKTRICREEEGLIELPREEIFRRLINPHLFKPKIIEKPGTPEFYKNSYTRFNLSDIGANSFDQVSIVLAENSQFQRCVWTQGENDLIFDSLYPAGHMQKIADEFCNLMETEFIKKNTSIYKYKPYSKSERIYNG